MRKRILTTGRQDATLTDDAWLDLEALAEVEISSEDPDHPIESALLPDRDGGWRANQPGTQTIRLLFPRPQAIRRIRLHFEETEATRMQEYVLRWSSDDGASFHEIVRQQWHFSPRGATVQIEDHQVDLPAVVALELVINPEPGNEAAFASLQDMRLA